MSAYILGPIHSRRLGKSLGIDLIPAKTCTYNCIYCQIMINTTNKTLNRQEWVPYDEVIKQMKAKLNCKPDIITITGCGETTLFSRIGELVDVLKSLTDTKIAVLVSPGDRSHDFIETLFKNAGYICTFFENRTSAMKWLI